MSTLVVQFRIRSERLRREIDDALWAGWEIEDETPQRVVLVRRGFGDLYDHAFIALLTAWWSFGVINAAYAAYKYLHDSQRRVLWEERRPCTECGVALSEGDRYCRNCGSDVGA